jgi:hypothetical protein
MQGAYPPVRHDACVATQGNQLFYYGGRPPETLSTTPTGGSEYGDLWVLDMDTYQWTQLCGEPEPLTLCQEEPPSGPEARHSACMWCWGQSIFLFGGAAKRQGVECTFGDFWRYSLTRRYWVSVPLRGALVSMRYCALDC